MIETTRTKNAFRNSSIFVLSKMTILVLSFVVRTLFIRLLGKELLGIEGLFSSILSILNLADAGVGTAVIFLLYKPIAEKDYSKISALMNFLNKFYIAVALFILIVGCSITPLVPKLINLENEIPNTLLYYNITVISTALSYLMAAKRCLFEAYQYNFVVNIVDLSVSVFALILKLAILILTRSFLIYLIVGSSITIISNIVIWIIYKKFFNKIINISPQKLDSIEKKEITKNILAVFSHRIGSVLVTGIDNLLISALLSTILVGIYSNYYLIISTIMTMTTMAISAFTPSVGNLKANNMGLDKDYAVYKTINFINFWIVCVTSICLFCLLNEFMVAWLDESFEFDETIVLLLCINYYISSMRFGIGDFATAAGYFKQTWFKPYIEGAVNLVVSIVLSKYIGITGIFLGTTISLLIGSFWIDPLFTFKLWFKKPVRNYFLNYLSEVVVCGTICLACYYITNLINFNINNWVLFFIKAIVCFSLSNILMLMIFFKKKEFIDVKDRIFKIVSSKFRKNTKKEINNINNVLTDSEIQINDKKVVDEFSQIEFDDNGNLTNFIIDKIDGGSFEANQDKKEKKV